MDNIKDIVINNKFIKIVMDDNIILSVIPSSYPTSFDGELIIITEQKDLSFQMKKISIQKFLKEFNDDKLAAELIKSTLLPLKR